MDTFALRATLGSSSLKGNQISFPQAHTFPGANVTIRFLVAFTGDIPGPRLPSPGRQTCFRANLERREAPGAWGLQPLCSSISFGDSQTKGETQTAPPRSDQFQKATQLRSFTFPRAGFTFPRLEHKVVSLTSTQGPYSRTLLSQASNLRCRVGVPQRVVGRPFP